MDEVKNYRYRKAKERVDKIKSFYQNMLAYCLVIPFLAFINYTTTSYPWVVFPAIGWGLGLIINGLCAYGYVPFLGRDWEERKINQLMNSNEF
ncbi:MULTISPECIES: 2TM domain-containing protein [Flavobacteriaceae]|uniref:2TM domain-containing protein n=1 Tax=Flavobacteriaceae TaxID=49546 RepID=UPI00149207A7|nr:MULTISPECIES: 2TM domain-containing protein [Allomuricauda]MDC6365110.1 2TM domain-containing protein [Muricauda sp. AC10]